MDVAILTGRDTTSARNILGLTSVSYHGNHGIESWERGNTTVLPEAQPFKRQIQRLARAAKSRLASQSGVLLEDKGLSLAFHYRQAPNPNAAHQTVLDFLASAPDSKGLVIYEGKMVIEAHLPVTADKGLALKNVVESKHLASAILLGDDLTDVDSFKMLNQLRKNGVIGGIAIAVLGSSTPAELLSGADYYLSDVESVEIFLAWLEEQVRGV
jgi:trehalose 6-phosphate phosphatase